MALQVLVLIPILTAALVAAVPPGRATERLHLAGSVATTATGLWLASQGLRSPLAGGQYLFLDALGAYLLFLVSVLVLPAAIYSVGYLRQDLQGEHITTGALRRYYSLFHLFWASMNAVCISNNLGIFWVAIEATTLSSALLVSFYHNKQALEAAWKYVIICTVGITCALLGTILLYAAGVHAFGRAAASMNWTALFAGAERLNPTLVRLAFIFCLVGYGTKAGLAPMHTWLPDAHSQAPTPVSAVLSGVLLNCAIVGILRFHLISTVAVGPGFSSTLLILFGLLSVAFAVPFIAVSSDLKRLLAYSTVEHMGIIALGFGLGSAFATRGALLHMLVHGLAKLVLFFAAGSIIHTFRSRLMGRIHGAVRALPISGWALVAGTLAITGMPPFGTFLSEWSIAWGAVAGGHAWIALILLSGLALIFAGMTYHVQRMSFGPASGTVVHTEQSRWMLVATVLPLAAVALLGVYVPTQVATAIDSVLSFVQGVY